MNTHTARPRAAKKPFGAIFDKYKTYDVVAEGYGSPDDWKDEFGARMGFEEAQRVVGSDKPRRILGVPADATWEEIKKAYRTLVLANHPDRAVGDVAKAAANTALVMINAAYSMLAKEFKK